VDPADVVRQREVGRGGLPVDRDRRRGHPAVRRQDARTRRPLQLGRGVLSAEDHAGRFPADHRGGRFRPGRQRVLHADRGRSLPFRAILAIPAAGARRKGLPRGAGNLADQQEQLRRRRRPRAGHGPPDVARHGRCGHTAKDAAEDPPLRDAARRHGRGVREEPRSDRGHRGKPGPARARLHARANRGADRLAGHVSPGARPLHQGPPARGRGRGDLLPVEHVQQRRRRPQDRGARRRGVAGRRDRVGLVHQLVPKAHAAPGGQSLQPGDARRLPQERLPAQGRAEVAGAFRGGLRRVRGAARPVRTGHRARVEVPARRRGAGRDGPVGRQGHLPLQQGRRRDNRYQPLRVHERDRVRGGLSRRRARSRRYPHQELLLRLDKLQHGARPGHLHGAGPGLPPAQTQEKYISPRRRKHWRKAARRTREQPSR